MPVSNASTALSGAQAWLPGKNQSSEPSERLHRLNFAGCCRVQITGTDGIRPLTVEVCETCKGDVNITRPQAIVAMQKGDHFASTRRHDVSGSLPKGMRQKAAEPFMSRNSCGRFSD